MINMKMKVLKTSFLATTRSDLELPFDASNSLSARSKFEAIRKRTLVFKKHKHEKLILACF